MSSVEVMKERISKLIPDEYDAEVLVTDVGIDQYSIWLKLGKIYLKRLEKLLNTLRINGFYIQFVKIEKEMIDISIVKDKEKTIKICKEVSRCIECPFYGNTVADKNPKCYANNPPKELKYEDIFERIPDWCPKREE